ncbi:EamA family transporter [Priestia filamentosa]|nr:DMT family transporter [Priestia filamentosa]MDT3762019.1 DMT family transporter [Priestia filamentosa]WCM17107.1 DMT family transporter [Priestia filamentosa]WRU96519.1 DMT family transporter [Priestia filamentosa]SMF63868.1 Threonine/homoserine efflux transporter RhtA [Priestia filamentosa]
MKIWSYALLVFLGGCSYGVVSTFVKIGYSQGFKLSEITGSQYLLGSIMLWIISIFVPKVRLKGKQWLTLILSGIPMGLTGIFYNQTLNYVNASFAIILLLQFTWISIILQYLFDKKVPTRTNLIATGIILFGSLLASGFLKSEIAFSLTGISFGLLAALSFALFIFLSGRTSIPIHPIYKSAIMTTGAALTIFVLLPPVFLVNDSLTNGLWIYGLLTGFFGSVIPPILFNIGMPKVGGSLGTILSASELPTAVTMSTIVLHETVTLFQWIGVVIILAGIAYPNIKIRQTYSLDKGH